jgi:hypothetical protein
MTKLGSRVKFSGCTLKYGRDDEARPNAHVRHVRRLGERVDDLRSDLRSLTLSDNR